MGYPNTPTEVEILRRTNEVLREEISRFRGEVDKWVKVAMDGIAVRERATLDLIMAGMLIVPEKRQ
jgi:hypothetical protein